MTEETLSITSIFTPAVFDHVILKHLTSWLFLSCVFVLFCIIYNYNLLSSLRWRAHLLTSQLWSSCVHWSCAGHQYWDSPHTPVQTVEHQGTRLLLASHCTRPSPHTPGGSIDQCLEERDLHYHSRFFRNPFAFGDMHMIPNSSSHFMAWGIIHTSKYLVGRFLKELATPKVN